MLTLESAILMQRKARCLPLIKTGLFLLLLVMCRNVTFAADPTNELLSKELKAIVQKQAVAWNDGKIDQFMEAYWKDERLSFASGGTLTRGWQATRDRYHRRYPDKETMGKLTFSELEVEVLSDSSALMLGRWKLDRTSPAEGNFSLVWRKIGSEWKIIHDHSSKSD